MKKNKNFIIILLSLSIFLTLSNYSFAKKNNIQTIFTPILGNEEKQIYKFALYFDNNSIKEHKKLIRKLFNCYALSKVPGISDETIEENLFLNQFYGYRTSDENLLLTNKDFKKIKKYYNIKNSENLIKSKIKNYDEFMNKIISLYNKNNKKLKQYIDYLEQNKSDDFYIKILDKVKNRDRKEINFIEKKELNRKQKIEKGRKIVEEEKLIAKSSINQNKKDIKKLSKIQKESLEKYKESCNIENHFKNSIDKSIISKLPEELELNFHLNYLYLNEYHLALYPAFILCSVGEILKKDKTNKLAQNLLKKAKEQFKKDIESSVAYFADFSESCLVRYCPITACVWKEYKGGIQEELKIRFDYENKKEINLLKDYLSSKKFTDTLKTNLTKEKFEKFKNSLIKKMKESIELKKEFLKKENIKKQIENIKKNKNRDIKENEKNLKSEKNKYPKTIKKEIERTKEFLNDEKKIKEAAERTFKKMKKNIDEYNKNLNKTIEIIEKITFEDFKTVYETIDLTKISMKNFTF